MNLILSLDIIFVNKVEFLVMISSNLKLTPNRRQEGILYKMKQIKSIYSHRGFRITGYNVDKKFEPLWDRLT